MKETQEPNSTRIIRNRNRNIFIDSNSAAEIVNEDPIENLVNDFADGGRISDNIEPMNSLKRQEARSTFQACSIGFFAFLFSFSPLRQ